MKREPGDIMEARRDITPPVLIVIALVIYVALSPWDSHGSVRGNVEFLVEHFD